MKRLFAILFCLLAAFSALGDRAALILENDCLLRTGRDEDYTHGTGLEYWYRDEWRFLLQQNMYTPDDITRYDHIVGDRPYCGWLGAAVGKELFRDPRSPWTHFAEIRMGMVGPSSKAGDMQRLIHEWRGCREPNGWENQLADEFCINAEWWTKYNWFVCDYVAVIPRAGVLVGNLQDAAEVGSDVRIGWNIRKLRDIGNNMMFSATADGNGIWDKLVVYAFVGGDCRYYLYNHVLEGSLFNGNDDGLGVHIEPFVGELQFGAYLEFYGVFVKWYGCFRTREYEHQKKAPDYGGLRIGYCWDF